MAAERGHNAGERSGSTAARPDLTATLACPPRVGDAVQSHTTLLRKHPEFLLARPGVIHPSRSGERPLSDVEAVSVGAQIAYGQMYDLKFEAAARTLGGISHLTLRLKADGDPICDQLRLSLQIQLELLVGANLDLPDRSGRGASRFFTRIPLRSQVEQVAPRAFNFEAPAGSGLLCGELIDQKAPTFFTALPMYTVNSWRLLEADRRAPANAAKDIYRRIYDDAIGARSKMSANSLNYGLTSATCTDALIGLDQEPEKIMELAAAAVCAVKLSGELRFLPEVLIRKFYAASCISVDAMQSVIDEYRNAVSPTDQAVMVHQGDLLCALLDIECKQWDDAHTRLIRLDGVARRYYFGHLRRDHILPSLLREIRARRSI